MKKNIGFIAIALLSWIIPLCQAQNKCQVSKNPLDTLNSPVWQKEYMFNDLENTITELFSKKPNEAGQAVLLFASKNERYRNTALRMLTRFKYNKLPAWLMEKRKNLSQYDWQFIYNELSNMEFEWRDTNIINVLFLVSIDDTNSGSRHYCLTALADMASYKIAKPLLKQLNVESDQKCRADLYAIMTRFKCPDFDPILKKSIAGYREPNVLNDLIEFTFKTYNRYDFLPDLYALQSRLKKEKDVVKISDAQKTLEALQKVIPYLEQKKSEKAPIGLPLDWGK